MDSLLDLIQAVIYLTLEQTLKIKNPTEIIQGVNTFDDMMDFREMFWEIIVDRGIIETLLVGLHKTSWLNQFGYILFNLIVPVCFPFNFNNVFV